MELLENMVNRLVGQRCRKLEARLADLQLEVCPFFGGFFSSVFFFCAPDSLRSQVKSQAAEIAVLREMVSGPRSPAGEQGPGGGSEADRSPHPAAQAAESGRCDAEGCETGRGKMGRWLKRAVGEGGGGAASAVQGETASDKPRPGLEDGGAEVSHRSGVGAPSEHEEE